MSVVRNRLIVEGKSMTESMTTDDAYQYGLVTGEFMERERIIALLKSASAYDRLKRNGEPTPKLDATIALIKGEN